MNLVEGLLLAAHVLVAIGICAFVLLQHGKGADMGAAFGSGASGSLFGATGSANFLSRTTGILAAVFFLTSLGLTWYGASRSGPRTGVEQGVMDRLPPSKASDIPAAPSAPLTAPAAPTTGTTTPAAPAAAPQGSSKAADVPK